MTSAARRHELARARFARMQRIIALRDRLPVLSRIRMVVTPWRIEADGVRSRSIYAMEDE